MSKEALTSACDSFRITIEKPDVDARSLTGRVELTSARVSSVELSLALFAHLTKRMGESGIAGETTIGGSSKTLTRASNELSFELPYSEVARAYAGEQLRIDAGVLARSDDGKTLRLVLPVEWQAPRTGNLVPRRLPITRPAAKPAAFFFAVALVLASAGIMTMGALRDVDWMYKGAFAAIIAGVILAVRTSRGVLGWLRIGRVDVKLEPDPGGVRVTVRTGPRATGGRAAMCLAEYEIEGGSDVDLCVHTKAEVPLSRESDGAFVAVVPAPSSDAPPSLALRMARRTVGTRWSVRIELDRTGGTPARFSIPIPFAVAARQRTEP